jgi:two-component system NtrC family sensor kinase
MKNKISFKLILAVGVMTISIISIFSFFMIKNQTQALITQVKHSANQLSETIKSSTKYDMLLNQRERVHRIIDTIGNQEGIEKVRIFNKEGEVIYSPNKSEIGSFVDKKAEACFVCHVADQPLEKLTIPERTRVFEVKSGSKNLGIINPIYNEASCSQAECHAHEVSQKVLGVLDVTMSLDDVERQVRSNRMELIFFTLISIITVSLILWILVKKVVGTPVSELVKATNIVATGDLDYRIKIFKKDELGHLGRSFNQMTQKLAEANKQIVQSNKLASLGRLAAGVAHEINNPLTGILTYSTYLLNHLDNNQETKEDIEVIVRETRRCGEIVKRLLEFARQSPPHKTFVDINNILNRAISIVNNQLSIRNISVHKNLEENLPEFKADANQLHQIFINLLLNAADAIDSQGGEISISIKLVKKVEEFIEIKVSDTGCGIPHKNISKIFDPFYTTKGHKGTGLGLAVVWGIIEQHNGTISVESEVGKGTVFTIHLPIEEKETSAIITEKNIRK